MSTKGPPQGGVFVVIMPHFKIRGSPSLYCCKGREGRLLYICVVARVTVRTHIDICFGASFRHPRYDIQKTSFEKIKDVF